MKPDSKTQKQKKQAIILCVLAIVLGVMAVRHFMPQPRKSSAALSPPSAAADATATAKQKLTLVQLTWPLIAEGDPFAPNGVYPSKSNPTPAAPVKIVTQPDLEPAVTAEQVREQARKALKLQGMILGAVPRAVVNNRPVAAGDEVDGFRIVSIEARRIVVRKSGFDVELELK